MKNLSRIMGGIWITTSLLWVGFGVAGLLYGLNWLENLEMGLDDNLQLIVDSLDPVHVLALEAMDIVSSTQASLTTVQLSVHDASIALADARPLLWTTTKVITTDVPDALDGVQESMPSLIETAKSVDETLTWLSGFGFTIPNPFGADWSYDLGINYNPEVPLNRAMEDMSGNLEGVPDDLRKMKESLNDADANLVIVSDDLALLATDLETMNQQIADISPQIESFSRNIEDIQASFRNVQETIPQSFRTAQKVAVAVLVLLVVTQLPSLYMGWILVQGKLDNLN
jgi:prefoldin subunit 5